MSTLPSVISLAQYSGTIFDQGAEGSCKANQICGAIALQANEYGDHIADLSRQQLYNDTRISQGSFWTDSGSLDAYAEKVATQTGIANESSFSYGQNNLYVKPNDATYVEEARQKVLSFTHYQAESSVSMVYNYVGNMLMQGKPVLVDAYVHYGFGVDPNSFLNPINGAHAYLIVGIDYASQTYTVQNSWGADWANSGYGTIKFTDLPGIGPTSGGAFGGHYQDLIGLSTIDGFEGRNLVYTANRVTVAQLYATILGRAAEVAGLDFWAGHGFTHAQMADLLINSAEGQSIYGGETNTQFVENMYSNVLGRHSDPAGLAYFVNFLNQGETRGQVISGVIDYLYNNSADLASHDYLVNKTNLSAYISIAMQYGGGHDYTTHLALSEVTADANQVELIKVGLPHDLNYS